MANTYTLLETVTVGAAGAASVTFNSIPQTGYTDLVIKGSIRTSYSGTEGSLCIGFNGSTANFTLIMLRGSGAAASSFTRTTFSENRISYINAVGGTASTFSNVEIYVPNYASANYKSISVDGVMEANATTAYSALTAGLWSQTAAITSLNFTVGTADNFAQYSTFSLYGVSALGTTPTKAPKATGGSIIQTDGTYWYHAFLSSGTFTPATALTCDVLVVAGGGGGGVNNSVGAGGGGAGGLLGFTSQSILSAQTVTIGAGGTGGIYNSTYPTSGSNSQFGSLTAPTGGGRGQGVVSGNWQPATNGGSGGGGGISTVGNGTAGQGNNGGGVYNGGGGGAGAVGQDGVSPGTSGGAGGIGATYNTTVGGSGGPYSFINAMGSATATGQLSGGNYYYAGGGGTSPSAGGLGGGGALNGGSGIANTGGGGSGINSAATQAGAGGSGIVIVRYLA